MTQCMLKTGSRFLFHLITNYLRIYHLSFFTIPEALDIKHVKSLVNLLVLARGRVGVNSFQIVADLVSSSLN